ncbi:MAG: PHP domain-containing protein [Lachnospiraceae bacterium]
MKTEMHIHTSEVSPCAHVGAREIVELYKRAGYDAIVITDHFNNYVLENYEGDDRQRVERYLKGYLTAKDEGEKVGLKVLFGVESHLLPEHTDFLFYGATPEFLYEYPKLYELSQKEAFEVCNRHGILLLQAHPFRWGAAKDPAYLHGMEVYNGNLRNPSHNEVTTEFVKQYPQFVLTSGSDFHMYEDVGCGGMILPEIQNERELADALRNGRGVSLIRFDGQGTKQAGDRLC